MNKKPKARTKKITNTARVRKPVVKVKKRQADSLPKGLEQISHILRAAAPGFDPKQEVAVGIKPKAEPWGMKHLEFTTAVNVLLIRDILARKGIIKDAEVKKFCKDFDKEIKILKKIFKV